MSRIKEILDEGLDYMSSEDSSDESVILFTRPLTWLKSKYSNSLKKLDTIHYNKLSSKSKGMVRQRQCGEPSERPLPSKPLSFAVNVEDQDSLNSSINSDY